jgi:hypothetical protein
LLNRKNWTPEGLIQTSVAESSKEGYGSEKALLSMVMIPFKIGRRFEATCIIFRVEEQAKQERTLPSDGFMLVSCLVYFPVLKMKAKCSSETLVDL